MLGRGEEMSVTVLGREKSVEVQLSLKIFLDDPKSLHSKFVTWWHFEVGTYCPSQNNTALSRISLTHL